jgi:Family of unknown function (DUF6526)
MAESQTHATHRRYYPLYHFVVLPLLLLNVIVRVVYAFRHAGARMVWWEVVFAVTLGVFAWTARAMALRVQDRLIVFEETTRMTQHVAEDIKHRVHELTPGELIALRFCDNADLDELTRAVLGGEVKGRENIKRRIRKWRPDERPRA